uniref:Uncharacterized protein n=1 Tax=uncultured bacterium contig00005 TaxID=1181497 RepID=A0A806JZA6_9BACT|nr:hypothetical protein [uncultured bacterium contig00005]
MATRRGPDVDCKVVVHFGKSLLTDILSHNASRRKRFQCVAVASRGCGVAARRYSLRRYSAKTAKKSVL